MRVILTTFLTLDGVMQSLGSPDEEFPWQTAGRAAVATLES